MSLQEDDLLRDLYGGDFEYHQDNRGDEFSWHSLAGIFLPALLVAGGLIYTSLYSLDFNLLLLPERLWNSIVYVTPSKLLKVFDHDRLIAAMDDRATQTIDDQVTSAMDRQIGTTMDDSCCYNITRTPLARGEMIRRYFAFDTSGGIMGSVAKAGRQKLSTLSGISLGAHAEDGRPPGLGNYDNSCYQNSVLQGLASLDTLSGYLKSPLVSSINKETVATDTDLSTTDSLRNLIASLKDPSNNGKRMWTPRILKSMSSWQQQDAQEYLSEILKEIDKEVAKAAKTAILPEGFESTFSSPEFLPKENDIGLLESLQPTAVRNPLEGLLAYRVGCTRCGYSEELSMIPFNCLTVSLGSGSSYDISECLDEYTKLETIEGVECGKCTLLKTQRLLSIILERIKDTAEDDQVRISTMARLRTITEVLDEDSYDDKTLTRKCNLPPKNRMSTTKSRQAVISRRPNSLAVHINRSVFNERTGALMKNYAEVKFPTILDLGPWCLGSSGINTDLEYEEWLLDPLQSMVAGSQRHSRLRGPTYELRAVITHYGEHNSGHYICYRKHPVVRESNGEVSNQEPWWRLSDADVQPVSEENVLNQAGVFMLFYDCIEPASVATAHLPSVEPTISVEIPESNALAASIPLPVESDDSLDSSDFEDQDSSEMSQEQSATASNSELGDDGSGEEEYSPTQAIHIPPRIQGGGNYTEEIQQRAMQSQGNMVMV